MIETIYCITIKKRTTITLYLYENLDICRRRQIYSIKTV